MLRMISTFMSMPELSLRILLSCLKALRVDLLEARTVTRLGSECLDIANGDQILRDQGGQFSFPPPVSLCCLLDLSAATYHERQSQDTQHTHDKGQWDVHPEEDGDRRDEGQECLEETCQDLVDPLAKPIRIVDYTGEEFALGLSFVKPQGLPQYVSEEVCAKPIKNTVAEADQAHDLRVLDERSH